MGDIRVERPSFWCTFGHSTSSPQQGRVIYIHPKRRFYVVEFTSKTGETFREAFFFEDRRVSDDEKGQDDNENDRDYE